CAYFVGGWAWIAREQSLGAHELSGCAEPALRSVMIDEGLLQGIEPSVLRETFDGLHGSAIGPPGQIAARINGFAIKQHGAGAAFAAVATDSCAGKVKMVAQKFHEGPTIFRFDALLYTVHGDMNCCSRNCFNCGTLRFKTWRCRRDSERRSSSLEEFPAGN